LDLNFLVGRGKEILYFVLVAVEGIKYTLAVKAASLPSAVLRKTEEFSNPRYSMSHWKITHAGLAFYDAVLLCCLTQRIIGHLKNVHSRLNIS